MSKKIAEKNRNAYMKPGFSFMEWLGAFGAEDIGIDLGTSNTVVYVKRKDLVYSEASAVVVREKDGKMLAYGTRAEEMEGKTPRGLLLVKPLRNSEIVDYEAATYLLNSIVNRSYLRSLFLHSRLIMCVPAEVTGVQRRALLEAAAALGARKAVLIDQPVAALMGMGLNTDKMNSAMLVDIGGGSASVSVVSRRGIVVSASLKEAGISMDQALMLRVQEKYRVQIGRRAAEAVKEQLGIRWDLTNEMEAADASGKSMVTGLPVKIGITGEDVAEALRPVLHRIYKIILEVLQKTPPALLANIREQGIMLCGGCAQLKGLDAAVTQVTGIPAYVTKNPMHIHAMGAGAALAYMDYMKDALKDL